MTKAFFAVGLLALSWINVIPQSRQSKPEITTATISGTSYDEKHFVNDADLKFWTVTNSRMLQGLAFEHCRLTGQLDATNHTIVVSAIRIIPPTRVRPTNDDDPLRR
jgi:hypothetical protein